MGWRDRGEKKDVESKDEVRGGLNGVVAFTINGKILAFLRLRVNFSPLRLTEILKISFYCLKKS